MSGLSLKQYLNELDDVLQAGEGESVSECLSIQHDHAASSKVYSAPNVESTVKKRFDQPWDEVIILHIRCLQEIHRDNFVEAFKHHFALVQYPFS
ncbi:hypothetical protein JTE90_001460 [Oedothorax gibbosus]|uniref:Uncharacterized protein n=1 Tax=Oedothorax gibbosus TaxID=931172 RepID=A0AAV6UC96_9ARAC|nr:hypothetical protein JTE90_001460 [Oedothorax gibbosus]